jgi:signal-transduction protein with cAMP-binding, CBS, and nucleotidyltransferase domain
MGPKFMSKAGLLAYEERQSTTKENDNDGTERDSGRPGHNGAPVANSKRHYAEAGRGCDRLASLRDVATQLVQNEFSGMPVADPDGRVIGVVTESDIVRTLIAGKRLESLTAGEVVTGTPITVEVETPIEDVMKQLEENRIVRVPVTDHNKLVGIISRRDTIRAILEPEFIVF